MSNKKKTNKTEPNPVVNQVNNDLIVHNMPRPSIKISGNNNSDKLKKNILSQENKDIINENEVGRDDKSNFKFVGLMIMIFGFIVIIVLIYFSYHFIVAPSLSPRPIFVSTKSLNKNKTNPTTTQVKKNLIATNTETIASSTISVITDLKSNSSSTLKASFTNNVASSTTNPILLDTDADGLNNKEEIVFGTSATSTDSDRDGYSDLAEINNAYNPMGSGKLSGNDNFKFYNNSSFSYKILYPRSWSVQELNQGATTIFNGPDDSLIQISIQNNEEGINILDWYEISFPNLKPSYDKMRTTFNWEGIMGEDGLNFYLTDKAKKYVFIISYITRDDKNIIYPNVFKAMINSLEIKS